MNKKPLFSVLLFLCFTVVSCCTCTPLHHEIQGEILLKDHIYMDITADFIVDSPEALHEVQIKEDQLRFAMTLSFREFPSSQFKGKGKRNTFNALKSIARQVLDHPVKAIHITSYEFHENLMLGDAIPQ